MMGLCVVMANHVCAAGKTFSIGTDNRPPYEEVINAELTGYSTEVVKKVLAMMGVEMHIQEYPWKRALRQLYGGKIDAVYSALSNEERQQYRYYPEEPLFTAKYVLFIRIEDRGKLRFESYEDLVGKKIGIIRGGVYPKEF